MKVFLDANIFFAGTRSSTGGSGFVLELAKKGKLEIYTIMYALLEAERNIKNKLGDKYLNQFYQNILETKIKIQSVEVKEIIELKQIVPEKDIPILLGAVFSDSKVLITLDKKHFLNNKELKKIKLPFEIMNPGDFLNKYIL
ncbi:hypothetical protein KKA24_02825 [Patescibacteria group bacterium]|nr:hypothetical protein [Patescibacteria group bacterium]